MTHPHAPIDAALSRDQVGALLMLGVAALAEALTERDAEHQGGGA